MANVVSLKKKEVKTLEQCLKDLQEHCPDELPLEMDIVLVLYAPKDKSQSIGMLSAVGHDKVDSLQQIGLMEQAKYIMQEALLFGVEDE